MQAKTSQKIGAKAGVPSRIVTALQVNRKTVAGYVLAVGAAMSYALAQVLTRQHISSVASPLAATVVTLISGMAVMGLMNIRNLKLDFRTQRQGIIFFSIAGIFASIGVASLNFALSSAPIVIVSPIVAINPLVSLVLAHIFLQRLEKITLRIFIGALLVVVGVVIIGLAR